MLTWSNIFLLHLTAPSESAVQFEPVRPGHRGELHKPGCHAGSYPLLNFRKVLPNLFLPRPTTGNDRAQHLSPQVQAAAPGQRNRRGQRKVHHLPVAVYSAGGCQVGYWCWDLVRGLWLTFDFFFFQAPSVHAFIPQGLRGPVAGHEQALPDLSRRHRGAEEHQRYLTPRPTVICWTAGRGGGGGAGGTGSRQCAVVFLPLSFFFCAC